VRSKWTRLAGAARQGHLKRIISSALTDALVTSAAFTFVLSARAVITTLDFIYGLEFVIAILPIFLVSFFMAGVYHRIWARTSGHEITVIIKAVIAASVPIIWIDLLFQPRPLPLSVLFLSELLALAGFISIRYRSRLISGMSWRWKAIWRSEFPKSQTHVLIVGAGEAGQTLAWRLKYRSHEHGYAVVGFVDDDPDKQGLYIEGCRVLGTHPQIPRLAELHNVDLIIVAINNITGAEFREILTYCEATSTPGPKRTWN
jgi:FlaA1/EpsC-like NDP-sugar epimerase